MALKAKNSILLLSQTLNDLKLNLKHLVEESFKHTNNNLFIYINPYLNKILSNPINDSTLLFNDRYKLKLLINQFYQYSLKLNPNINVTCLLHNVHKQTKLNEKQNYLNYDLILTDLVLDSDINLQNFLKSNLPNSNRSEEKLKILSIPCKSHQSHDDLFHQLNEDPKDQILHNYEYENSIIGGTFDRLHIGHKILLSESALLTKHTFLIGVSDGPLLAKKKLVDLIQDFDVRCKNVKTFLNTVSPDLEVLTVRITDPFGPSITERDYQVRL